MKDKCSGHPLNSFNLLFLLCLFLYFPYLFCFHIVCVSLKKLGVKLQMHQNTKNVVLSDHHFDLFACLNNNHSSVSVNESGMGKRANRPFIIMVSITISKEHAMRLFVLFIYQFVLSQRKTKPVRRPLQYATFLRHYKASKFFIFIHCLQKTCVIKQ